MKKRNKFVRPLFEAALSTAGAAYHAAISGKDIIKYAWEAVKPEKANTALLECQYCCEYKRDNDFVARGAIPWICQSHLSYSNRVCKNCMDAALKAQFEIKPLIEVGCPQCGIPWEPEDVRMLISHRTQKKFRELDRLARQQVLVPADLPDKATVELLLDAATRFCPWCRWPFVKVGGCDSMLCSKCAKFFDAKYALVLEDGAGRRAADIERPATTGNYRT